MTKFLFLAYISILVMYMYIYGGGYVHMRADAHQGQ